MLRSGLLGSAQKECGPSGLGGGGADDPVIAAHRNASMEAFMYAAYARVRDEVRPELIVHFDTIGSPSQYGSQHQSRGGDGHFS